MTSGTIILVIAQVVGQLIGFAMLALVSRRIGPYYLGAFQFDIQLEVYFSLLATLGLTLVGTRDLARGVIPRRQVLAETLALRVCLVLVAFLIMLLAAPTIAPTHAASTLMPVIACFLLVDVVNLEWVLQGLQRLPAVAVSRLAGQIAYGASMPFLLTAGLAGATRFADANLLGLAIAAIAGLVLLRRGALPDCRVRWRQLSSRLVRSLPFAWSLVMIQIYYSIDTLMLGYLGNSAQVGQYGVAYRLPQAATTIIGVWVAAQYPALAARAHDRTAIAATVGLAASLAAVLGLAFLLVIPVSHPLMAELFGSAFRPAGAPFLILMANAAVILVSVNFGNPLLALGDERRVSVGLTLGAALNVALNFLLIPRFGPTGAACATLATEVFIIGYMYRRCQRVLGSIVLAWPRLFRGLGAFAPSLVAVLVLDRLVPALVAATIAGVLYLALAVRFGALPVAALRPVRRQ